MPETQTPKPMSPTVTAIVSLSVIAAYFGLISAVGYLPGQSCVQAVAAQVSVPRMPPAPVAAAENNVLAKRAVRECQFASNAKLLITTTSGVLFEVDVQNVTVANHDSRLDGTYVDIDLGRPDVVIVERPAPYYASNAIIRVRTKKDRAAWQDALDKVKTKFYAPRDVAPPPVQ